MGKTPTSVIDGLIVRPSGPWIRKKYFFLERYADIFTRGMKRQWDLTYIDLFAGPGRCRIDLMNEETDGSPLIALNYDFSRYIFIEKDEKSYDALKKRCADSPKRSRTQFIPGDCNSVIQKVDPTGLSLAFIDPTGIDIHFDTIKTLTKNRRVDLLMTIQLGMDIKRNFGAYVKTGQGSQLDLFLGGGVDWQHLKTPRDVVTLYKSKVRELGYSTVESKDIEVRNIKRR